MTKMHVVLVSKMCPNGTYEIIHSDQSANEEILKSRLPKEFKPYFDDAVRYGQDKVWFDERKFNIFYKYWNIQE